MIDIRHPAYRFQADETGFDELVIAQPQVHIERMSEDCVHIVIGHGNGAIYMNVVSGRAILIEGEVEVEQ